jgi:outer membrane protein assembly factor BamB
MKPIAFYLVGTLLGLGGVVWTQLAGAEEKSAPLALFGGTVSRNLVNLTDKNIPDDFVVRPKGKEKHVKWVAALGSKAYGGPVIAGGRIYVGTNNDKPRDPKVTGDRGVLMCFNEADGKFLWQITHEKLEDGELNDYPKEGLLSTPCVQGDRLWYVSNRCELVCADAIEGKIIWSLDMVKELGVFPCQASNCSPLVVGDLVYAVTSNGVNVSTNKLPAPKAPSLVAVNKKTGQLVWSNNLPGAKVLRGQWTNPTAATVDGKTQILYGGGDGWMYGLDASTGELLWKFDCNPKKAKPYKPGGGGERSFFIATPVVVDNRCYIAVGQEPDDGPGVGHLWCIDISKKPANKERDLSAVDDNFDPKAAVNKDSGLVWHYGGPMPPGQNADRDYVFGRTMSTVAVHDGIVYAPELAGYLHAVDAVTGKKLWEYDFQESTWCSAYYVDGKVFVGTDAGDLYIFKAGRTFSEPKKISIGQPVKVPPVASGGVLYVNSGTNLYAIARP